MKFTLLFLFLLAAIPNLQAQTASTSAPPPVEFRVTDKEVAAVQVGLIRRGYLTSGPSGTLDRATRDSLRAYQSDNGLKVTGRIDQATYRHLGLSYPATGKEAETLRKAAGEGLTAKLGAGTKSGLGKTKDAGVFAATKSKDAVVGAGRLSVRGAKGVGRTTQRAGSALFARPEDEVHYDVEQELNADPATRGWYFELKSGAVTLKVPRQHNADIGKTVSNLRKIVGVRSVFVIIQ